MNDVYESRMVSLIGYIKDLDIAYVDLYSNFERTGIDCETDFHDKTHLNVIGSEKATRYIGKCLWAHYAFETNYSPCVGKMWEREILRYDMEKKSALEKGK